MLSDSVLCLVGSSPHYSMHQQDYYEKMQKLSFLRLMFLDISYGRFQNIVMIHNIFLFQSKEGQDLLLFQHNILSYHLNRYK